MYLFIYFSAWSIVVGWGKLCYSVSTEPPWGNQDLPTYSGCLSRCRRMDWAPRVLFLNKSLRLPAVTSRVPHLQKSIAANAG